MGTTEGFTEESASQSSRPRFLGLRCDGLRDNEGLPSFPHMWSRPHPRGGGEEAEEARARRRSSSSWTRIVVSTMSPDRRRHGPPRTMYNTSSPPQSSLSTPSSGEGRGRMSPSLSSTSIAVVDDVASPSSTSSPEPFPRPIAGRPIRGPGGVPWFIVDFLFVIAIGGTQYIFYVFPRRIFGEASFFLKQKILDHEKSRWHARRMPRRTPKPWGTLAPSSSRNLHTMSEMPICWGQASSDATSTKWGSSAILD